MKEYIDLAEAKSKAVYMHGFGQAKFVSVANLEKCKAADVVERKRGEWIKGKGYVWACSCCDAETAAPPCETPLDEGEYYCYYCGADMRGENHVRED